MEQLYTYQDLMALFRVHYSTVRFWFKYRRKFKPSGGTVRIPASEVEKFIHEKTTRTGKR